LFEAGISSFVTQTASSANQMVPFPPFTWQRASSPNWPTFSMNITGLELSVVEMAGCPNVLFLGIPSEDIGIGLVSPAATMPGLITKDINNMLVKRLEKNLEYRRLFIFSS
jgi:hypothetical protein